MREIGVGSLASVAGLLIMLGFCLAGEGEVLDLYGWGRWEAGIPAPLSFYGLKYFNGGI